MTYTLSELNFYPIKSCAGTTVSHATVDATGLLYDRYWMVCDPEGNFFTQRELPHMALIRPLIEDDGQLMVRLTAPNMEPFYLKPIEIGRELEVEIWADRCRAIDQGDEIAEWLSRCIQTKSRLVAMDPHFRRIVDEAYSVSPTDHTRFADGFPVLLTSQASLDELNGRLEIPISMNRFRPNLVVSGCDPFEEDRWKVISIGSVEFAVVKPCARCVITTIEQSTGRGGTMEPLKTLATYRRIDKNVMFGQNLIPLNAGELRLGDTVEIRHFT